MSASHQRASTADVPPVIAILRAERLRRTLPQTWVAGRLDCTVSAISLWESGQRDPSLDTLLHWCALFGLELRALPRDPGAPVPRGDYQRGYDDARRAAATALRLHLSTECPTTQEGQQ